MPAPDSARLPRVPVLDLTMTACTSDDVATIIADAIHGRVPALHLATVNLDFLRLADADTALRRVLMRASHCFADGWPIISLAKRAGHVIPQRVTGSDLTPRILAWAHANGWRVALVGSTPATKAALRTHPHADTIVGHWLPDYRNAETLNDPSLSNKIKACQADIILVALGCPKQEHWIAANLAASGATVAMGVGASLDFVAGTRKRAPRWIQTLRAEFLHRLFCEPRRLLGRYAADAWYLLLVRMGLRGRHPVTPGTYPDAGMATRIYHRVSSS